jgi:hypothetical protein
MGNKCGYVDAKGKWLIPPKYDYADRYYPDGLAVVSMNSGRSLFIDRRGRVKFKAPMGLWVSDWQRDDRFIQLDDGKHTGFMDRTSVIKIPLVWDEASGFAGHNLAPVKLQGKWGYIGRDGQLKIEAKFESANSFNDGRAEVTLGANQYQLLEDGTMEPVANKPEEPFSWDEKRKIGELHSFANNIHGVGAATIVTARGSKEVLVNSAKVPISKPYNFIALDDDKSLFYAQLGEDIGRGRKPKFGFIGSDGKVKIPFIFTAAKAFGGNDVAFVEFNGKWGSIDRKGRWVIQPKFDRLSECSPPMVRISR